MPYTTQPDIPVGGQAKITFNGVEIFFRDLSVNTANTLDDITTNGDYSASADRTWMRDMVVASRDTISGTAFMDASNDGEALLQNAELTNVVVTFRTGKTRTYPSLIVESVNRQLSVVTGQRYTFTARSQGPVTIAG